MSNKNEKIPVSTDELAEQRLKLAKQENKEKIIRIASVTDDKEQLEALDEQYEELDKE